MLLSENIGLTYSSVTQSVSVNSRAAIAISGITVYVDVSSKCASSAAGLLSRSHSCIGSRAMIPRGLVSESAESAAERQAELESDIASHAPTLPRPLLDTRKEYHQRDSRASSVLQFNALISTADFTKSPRTTAETILELKPCLACDALISTDFHSSVG